MTGVDVAGKTITPTYYSYSSTRLRFFDLALVSSTATIVDNGNDIGVMESFNTNDPVTNGFAQAKFYPDQENTVVDSINGGLDLSAKKYSAVVLERNFSGMWFVDSGSTGMTDYSTTGWYASRDGFKDLRQCSKTYWKDGTTTYDLDRCNYIVLVDKALLSKYFIFNAGSVGNSFPIGTTLFNIDGTLKPGIPGYSQLSDSERELISYLIVSTANVWGADNSQPPLNFKNQWMDPSTPQPFSSYIFIPTNPIDLTDMVNHQSVKIQITWDMTDVLYEEYELSADYGADYPFLTYSDPWNSTSYSNKMDPSPETGNATILFYNWSKRFWSTDGIDFTPYMPGETPPTGAQIYIKKPFLWERDPIGGPMNWAVAVLYDE